MQHVDRVDHIQALPQPGWARCPRVEAESLLVVLRPEGLDRIRGHCGGRRDLEQQPAVRSPELKHAVGLSIDLVALLVHGAVVAATLCRAPDYAECERGVDGEADLASA